MSTENLKTIITTLLQDFSELFVADQLNITKLISIVCPDGKSTKLADKIIAKLLNNPTTKQHFFSINDNYCLFKASDFKFFWQSNKTYSSYTWFANKIGLAEGNKYLKHCGDVVLNFPFKDCVLAGGQSSEDGQDYKVELVDNQLKQTHSTRKEIFFNEIVAKDDIDVLLKPKALTNFQSYGERQGQINHQKDNLLIKGNNLFVLYSLLPIYQGKVKLIYIDPPYNTGNDGFKYNDNFNHSTWLTFMKNRLEVARELLSDDGVIFVQCDDNEQAYLKVLMDEVFGRDEFITVISRIAKTASNKGKLFAPSCFIDFDRRCPERKYWTYRGSESVDTIFFHFDEIL
ncbi:MAG: site-specific DNA-methyltransferase, partial [Proteobacteria bacterium]|nr:site-specific DNA-methyltransferase [Pseudomonadota bacterium]